MNEVSRRFILIKPCCIGDAVMSIPVISNIKACDQQTEIDVWCGAHSQPVFQCVPDVRSIAPIPNRPEASDLPKLVAILRRNRDAAFMLLDRSRLIDFACRIARVSVVGTVRAVDNANLHETDLYLETLERAGIPTPIRTPGIELPSGLAAETTTRLGLNPGSYVVLHPGGAVNPGATMYSKRWPEANWRELINWFQQQGVPIVLTGGPAEKELCRRVDPEQTALHTVGSLSLIESTAVSSAARLFIGPDTGLSHMAAATAVPTIVIFGPTNPRHYAPRGAHVVVLAAPASRTVERVDLRHQGDSSSVGTAEVSVANVIDTATGIFERRICAS